MKNKCGFTLQDTAMFSGLNPEAPEFYPHFAAVTQTFNQDLKSKAKSKKAYFNKSIKNSGGVPAPDPVDELDEGVAALITKNSVDGHDAVAESIVEFFIEDNVIENLLMYCHHVLNFVIIMKLQMILIKINKHNRMNMKAKKMNGFKILGQCIQAAKQLPSGASHSTFKTFTDFNIITKQLTENVLTQSNHILAAESEVKKLKSNDNERNYELVVETNDNILDRANIQIDVAAGISKAVDPSICGLKNPLNHVASWNTTPVIHKIQMGSATLIGAKNIPRPQLNFKDPVDNSDSLWVPKISDKPNNIKPLALSILYNDNGEAVGYEHPYQMELERYRPPKELLSCPPEPPAFPPSLSETPLTRVDTESELDRLVQHLRTVKELAVDVEHHSYRSYQGITCLIQLSTEAGGDFIVDTLALREHLHKLNDAFTDPTKLKVFHGAEMDIIWLQRDFGVYVVGLFDTHQAAKLLKLTGLSLKNLLMRYCKVDADKKYQLADWRMRPLPAELVQYARVDTHYLLYVWRRMRSELVEAGAGATTLLQAAFEQSRQVCGLTYNKEAMHEHSHLPLYLKSKKSFNSQQLAALKLLYKWRDAQARELDESTSYLLPNQMLLTLAESLPGEVQGVNACCSPMPPFVKQHLITIHRMLLSCRELPLEPQLYQMPLSISTMVEHTRQAAAVGRLHDLSHFPDYRDDLPIAVSVEASLLHCDAPEFTSDIPAFQPASERRARGAGTLVVSDLNADAKSFIPPYERYKKYRCLAQIEEIKEFKEKEAKISAIGKGDDMIKKEVLDQLKDIRDHAKSVPVPTKIGDEIKHAIRKRKMSSEIAESKKDIDGEPEKVKVPNIALKIPTNTDNHKGKSVPKNQTKPYDYKNANYKKFFDDSDKFARNKHGPKKKHPKTSFKKHRK